MDITMTRQFNNKLYGSEFNRGQPSVPSTPLLRRCSASTALPLTTAAISPPNAQRFSSPLQTPPPPFSHHSLTTIRNPNSNPTATLATAAAATQGPASHSVHSEDVRQDIALRRWIQDHGGFVHDAISLTSTTQCGSRGLVASEAISLSDLESHSLVVVPRHLHMDNAAAVAAVSPLLATAARQQAFAELGQLQQVACYLAIERAKGDDSFWMPYIRTLPPSPPNPWLLSGGSLAEVLEQVVEAGRQEMAAKRAEAAGAAAATAAAAAAALEEEVAAAAVGDEYQSAPQPSAADVGRGADWVPGRSMEGGVGWRAGRGGGDRNDWANAVAVARQRYGNLADEVLEVVGGGGGQQGLLRGLDLEGLMWALGQVVSRSLGSGSSSGLLPYIDLANHDSSARPPMMLLDDTDRLVFAVTSIRGGELVPLEAGQELFISYQAEDLSPLQAWLKWGFVPHCLTGRGW